MNRQNNSDRAAAQDEAKLSEVENEVERVISDLPDGADLDEGTADLPEKPDNTTRLRNTWTAVKQLEATWRKAKERLETDVAQIADERTSLETARAVLAERTDRLSEREASLARAEVDLEEQRSSARAGFADDLRAMTREAVRRRDEALIESEEIVAAARVRAEAARAAVDIELETERTWIREARSSLRQDSLVFRHREEEVEAERQLAQAKSSMIETNVARRVEAQIADVRQQLEDALGRLELERSLAGARENELRDLRSELSRHGEDPESAKRRRDELAQQVVSLRNELSRRPPADEVADLRTQLEEQGDARQEAAHWRRQHDQIERQLRYQLVSVGEIEVLRDERDVLAAQRETLRQAVAQQRTDWEELQAKESSQVPFPAASAYDRDGDLSQTCDMRDVDDLSDLATELRERMATDSRAPYYYSGSDVRIFLAGLAASRLHLLQGISGTGKTSLPREFFRALSGHDAAQIVEVQAGWRDKDDLFGYYNAFEKRFVESEFTKALYRALLPANADRPMVVILDEMNLAHPEQYFGSMLSILENAVTEGGHLDLLTSVIPGLPERFDGSRLPLARNVWFVGTANHDETTVAFADKTYDRAHVQELPSRHERFEARPRRADDPVSFSSLERAFRAAEGEHKPAVTETSRFLAGVLHHEFAKFGVGWGNRLDRQVQRFVPVDLASGGTLTEAVDHLVATKLVRKLEDRFGVRPDELDQLADDIASSWTLDGDDPVKTVSRIRAEADRLRGGFGS